MSPWVVSTHHILRNNGPDPIGCNAVAVEEIQRTRQVKNEKPCIRIAPPKETEALSREAKEERERRGVGRALYEELSLYYPPEPRQKEWSRRQLLAVGKHERYRHTHEIQLTRISFSYEGPGSRRA